MEQEELVAKTEESLKVNSTTERYLTEIRKWANFLAIMGFIAVGFLIVAAIGMAIVFSFISQEESDFPFPMVYLSGIYLVMAIVYFIPVYYLYQFSVKMKYALQQKADDILETSFMFLKSHYKFIGIFTIVMLVLYPIMLIGAIIFGVLANF